MDMPVEFADAGAACAAEIAWAEKTIEVAKDTAVAGAVENMRKSNVQITELLQRQTDADTND
eukprot:3641895-Pyramimonas_sp.AAC.1